MLSDDFEKFALSSGVNIRNSYSNQVINTDGSVVDIYSKMLSERIIFLTTEVNSEVSNIIKTQLLYLNTIGDSDICIYIDSPGGSIYTGMGILDVMDYIDCDISTVNIGLAASMAAVILSYGTKGKRKTLKRSRTLIHQPIGGLYGQASDIEIEANQILKVKKELVNILSQRTGQPIDRVKEDSDRDYWMNGMESMEYGIVDIIL